MVDRTVAVPLVGTDINTAVPASTRSTMGKTIKAMPSIAAACMPAPAPTNEANEAFDLTPGWVPEAGAAAPRMR